jgi:hypothetical protein
MVRNGFGREESVKYMGRELISDNEHFLNTVMLQLPPESDAKLEDVDVVKPDEQLEMTLDLQVRLRCKGFDFRGFPVMRTVGYDDSKLS